MVVVVDQLVAAAADGRGGVGTVREVVHHRPADLAGGVFDQPRIGRVFGQQGGQVATVQLHARRWVQLGPRQDGRIEIDPVHHHSAFRTCLDAGPGDDQRHPHATLLGAALAPGQRRVVREGLSVAALGPAVVRAEDQVGVLDQLVARPAGVFCIV